jgi:predicted N-acyltransferase
MYELSLAESITELGSDLWRELEGPLDYPFLAYEWLFSLEESGTLGPARGWIPRHLVFRRGREVVAVAPAYLKLHSFGEFVFDQGWAEFSEMRLGERYYPKLVLAVPFTPATGPRILFKMGVDAADRSAVYDLLTGALPELAEKLGLSSVHILFPDDDSSAELVERNWALRLGIQFQWQNEGYQTFEDYLGCFKSKRRAAIRRECREVANQKIRIEVLQGSEISAGQSRLAYELYLTTVDKHVWGRRYLTHAFFERVMATMPESIHFVLARDASGDVLGGAFNLLGKEALYGRYWGAFQEVPFLHFNVCLYEGVRECIARGLSRFEPGAGGGHKEGRGFAPTITRSVHFLRHPGLDVAVRDFCRREAEGIRAHVAAANEGEQIE